jgi:hypothetical protein
VAAYGSGGVRRRLCIVAALGGAIGSKSGGNTHMPPQSKKAESGREKAILSVDYMPVPEIPLLTSIFTSTRRF